MKLEVMRKMLMITAAVVSSFLAPWIRPAGRSGVSPGLPSICGMTATPVSNPDRPRASFGKITSATPIITRGLPRSATSAWDQSGITCGAVPICQSPTATTTALSSR